MQSSPGALPDSGVSPITDDESALFRTLFDLAPDPIVIHDGVRMLEINEAAAHVLGFAKPADAVGAAALDFVAPQSREAVGARMAAILAGEPFDPLVTERFATLSGAEIIADVAARPVTYKGQRAVLLMVRDVTDRVVAQEAARVSEENYRVLFELSPDPSVVHDGQLIIRANAAMAAFMNMDADAAIGTSFWPLVREDCRASVIERVQEMAATGLRREPLKIGLMRPDGSEIVAETASAPLSFAGAPAFMTVFRDLTPRINAEQQAERYRAELEQLVAKRTAELATVRTELDAIVAVVMRTVELRDPYTAGHQERVALLADAMAAQLELVPEEREHLGVAARLHDIGKVTIPAEILSKPGRLSEVEYLLMKGHAQATADILLSVKLDWPLAAIARQHHERLDGSGYPDGLVGEEILPLARVLAVADVVEAMSSHRPYRPSLGVEAALAEVRAGAGGIYDQAAVEACIAAFGAGFAFDD